MTANEPVHDPASGLQRHAEAAHHDRGPEGTPSGLSNFVLIHGAGDAGWYWHLVEAELRRHGHGVVAPDLPCDDDSAGLQEYADAVVKAIDARNHLVVVGQSFGGFTAPMIADRLPVDMLVLVAGMIPAPAEAPRDYWKNTGYHDAVKEQAARDGGLTGHQDPYVLFYHDVPRRLAEQAMRRARSQSSTPDGSPWPLEAWPNVPTKFVLCTEDRLFPRAYLYRVAAERLNIVPDEIVAGHCVALSRPRELTELLTRYADGLHRESVASGISTPQSPAER